MIGSGFILVVFVSERQEHWALRHMTCMQSSRAAEQMKHEHIESLFWNRRHRAMCAQWQCTYVHMYGKHVGDAGTRMHMGVWYNHVHISTHQQMLATFFNLKEQT